jgi:acyl-homoserine lactone acylase PvdQ
MLVRARVLALAVVALAVFLPGGPAKAQVPVFSGFHSVLAQGEGGTTSALDLAGFQAFGTVPPHFTDQQPLYAGIMPAAARLTAPDIDTYYKSTVFGTMPGATISTEHPRSGVTIERDGYGMSHVTGATRADVMWGAGYAQAQERLFLMDVVRRMAKGTLSYLLGPGQARGDAEQLTDQDFSDSELQAQADAIPGKFGAAGKRAHDDILAYVDGINARIRAAQSNPLLMPAEYAALGASPAPWTVSDTAAAAVLLVTQFTVSNGGEEINAALRDEFRRRFGKRWRGPYTDLREAQDPGALVVAKKPFLSDDPGPIRSGHNIAPDAGSLVARNPLIAGPGTAATRALQARTPAWIRSVMGLRKVLPPVESNAVMVPRRFSKSGNALAAMGPQVGYYSPQIFSEQELHGGGIDVEGVTFPGASPYPLIGHGIDFAWSGTSANGDNQDTFAERLCEPGGAKPTRASTHYVYKGRCIPFVSRIQSVTTPFSVLDAGTPPTTLRWRTLRSVHGPVFAYATWHGAPIALAKAKAVDFHELDAVIPFMRLAENEPRDARSFMRIMGPFPGTENWFYVDRRAVAFQQSGRYPRHARGSDLDLPFRGDGPGDWQSFDPVAYTARYIPSSHRPAAIDPADGFIISWNQKEAIGWRKGPREWSGGPIQDALRLRVRLLREYRRGGGRTDLAGLTRAVNLAATTDLRGEDVLPWMLKVVGSGSAAERPLLSLLRAWVSSGAQRLDSDGDNVYEHSAAVALFDAWWPRAVKAEFGRPLGERLFAQLGRVGLSTGDFGAWGWNSHVQKDMRAVLGRRFAGRYRFLYCGQKQPLAQPRTTAALRRARARCRGALLRALDAAANAVHAKLGSDPARWRVFATCAQAEPARCDQEVPTAVGAIETPAFPWQDRGTYHQVVEVGGHR